MKDGKLTERDRKALRESIRHWQRLASGTERLGETINNDSCPLCQIYNNDEIRDENRCLGCPIREDTGFPFCHGTPYQSVSDAMNRTAEEFRAAAVVELSYLSHLAGRIGVSLKPQQSRRRRNRRRS